MHKSKGRPPQEGRIRDLEKSLTDALNRIERHEERERQRNEYFKAGYFPPVLNVQTDA